jgi:hypothetical protein
MRRMRTGRRGDRVRAAAVSSDRKLLWTLVIFAGAVLGWTLAVELEIAWAQFVGLAGALVVLVLIWFWPDRQEPDEPPP